MRVSTLHYYRYEFCCVIRKGGFAFYAWLTNINFMVSEKQSSFHCLSGVYASQDLCALR